MTAPSLAPTPGSVRVYTLGDPEFRAISKIAREEAGLNLSDSKQSLVYSRLVNRLRLLGIEDFRAYVRLLKSEDGAAEMGYLISALTTNVTAFFRECHHFAHLQADVAPVLADMAHAGERIRLWSTACSSGEEAYSIAMSLLAGAPELARRNVRILATDIDPQVLEHGRAGVYSRKSIDSLPAPLVRRFLGQPSNEPEVVMPDELRAMIAFRKLNLMADWPFSGPFDAIFCRNVAISFDKPTQFRLWARLHEMLKPGGYLYIGHSERVAGPAAAGLVSVGSTLYRKAAEPPEANTKGTGTADVT